MEAAARRYAEATVIERAVSSSGDGVHPAGWGPRPSANPGHVDVAGDGTEDARGVGGSFLA